MDLHGASTFDSWYSNLVGSSRREELLERHLGLPPLRLVSGMVPWSAVDDLTTSLRLVPDEVLLDLACGRGGYGLEVADRTRCRLIGVDISAEAVKQATANAEARDAEGDFRVGELERTGLERDSVDAVMCLDAVQFSLRPINTYAEIRRVLRPEGRVVVTSWEARDRRDPELEELWRTLDVADGLERAGFEDVEREVCADWSEQELALWTEAATLDPGHDASLASLVTEAHRVLPTFGRLDRVMVTATAPA